MATPNENLAASLKVLADLQRDARRVFKSDELTPIHRRRLLKNGFIQEVMKGWVISSSPHASDGDSTPWYASFWEFCDRYCEARFGTEWHLTPEQSLILHAENTVIPPQVIVATPSGTNNKLALPFGTSLYDLKEPGMPAASALEARDNLRIFSPPAALVRVSEGFLQRHALESRIVLRSIGDAADILRHLLEGGHPYVAGRLAGAFRNCDRAEIADEILATMTGAGYTVRETNPFTDTPALLGESRVMSPIESRIRNLLASMRQDVLDRFPAPPGLPEDHHQYLQRVEENYASDAYHSLSIEGYSVSPELVERVRAGNSNPDTHQADRQSRDALAARGYWQAFQVVKANIGEVIGGANAGALARRTHREWYRELFNPCVAAGLIPATALAGYRNDAVYLRTSRYVPPRWEAAREAVPVLFDLLENEPDPGVKAVLGHWFFGYIHPYPDGNGRLARFLMNVMLASGGYPWTIIRVEDRPDYLRTLDEASIESNIGPFTDFIAGRATGSTLTSG